MKYYCSLFSEQLHAGYLLFLMGKIVYEAFFSEDINMGIRCAVQIYNVCFC